MIVPLYLSCGITFCFVYFKFRRQTIIYFLQVHNATSEKSIEEFIESSAEIDLALPTKIRAKKLAKADLSSCEEYQTYKKNHCFEGLYAFQVKLNTFIK